MDGWSDGFGAVGLGPAVFHFLVSLFDAHLEWSVRHSEGNKFLPMFGPSQAARGCETLQKRSARQRREQAEDRKPGGPGADLLECALGGADGIVIHAEDEGSDGVDIALG